MQLDQPDFPRDRNGNPKVIHPETGREVVYRRPSGFCEMVEARGNLEKWKMARVVEGAVTRPELLPSADDLLDNPRVCDVRAEELFKAGGGTTAADAGTDAHLWLALLDKGEITRNELPEYIRPLADNWHMMLATHGLRVVPEYVERAMVCDELGTAGTVDNIVERISDGTLYVVDKKTGRQISNRPATYAGQVYIYAKSDLYDPETGERTKVAINQETAFIAHLPISGESWALIPIDLTAAAEVVEVARRVHSIRSSFPVATPLDAPAPIPPGTASPERRAWVKDRTATVLRHSDAAQRQVLSRWPGDVPPFKGGHLHTDDELNKIIAVLQRVEADHDIPFGPSDPDVERIEENDVALIKKFFPDAVEIEEDDEVDPEVLVPLRDVVEALPDASKVFLSRITQEAKDAGRPLSLTQCPSRRRKEIAEALVTVSMNFNDDDIARALVSLVEPEALAGATLGRLFGGLRTEQAVRLNKIALALDAGSLTLSFSGDGTPEIQGDVQSVAA